MRGKIEFEVGFFNCSNVLVAMWKAAYTAWHGWRFVKRMGGDPTRNYAVFLKGTDLAAALTGPMVDSKERAEVVCETFNRVYGQEA